MVHCNTVTIMGTQLKDVCAVETNLYTYIHIFQEKKDSAQCSKVTEGKEDNPSKKKGEILLVIFLSRDNINTTKHFFPQFIFNHHCRYKH